MDLEIQAQHTEVHPRWRELIDRRIDKLDGMGATFVRLHITLVHSTHHLQGNEEVRILAAVSGETLRVQKRKQSMNDALHAAFVALEREYESYQARRHRPSLEYGPPYTGVVSRLFGDRGYGFIRTPEDQEIYFHRDVVHSVAFEELSEGLAVEFEVEHGEKGPQAARVAPAKPGTGRD
jgi:cold shock CspA family protein/ribosome-associated translation inhibitor RaiA